MRSFRRVFLFLISTLPLMVAFQNCGRGKSLEDLDALDLSSVSGKPGFDQIQQSIIGPSCLGCHSSGSLDFSSYSALMNSGTIKADDANASSFYTQVQSGAMPQALPGLSSAQKQLIYNWIQAGAPEVSESPADPTEPDGESGDTTIHDLTATSTSATSVQLTWSQPIGATALVLQRSLSIYGPFTTVATLAANVQTYSEGSLTSGKTYYYQIIIQLADGTSETSNIGGVFLNAN